MLSRVLGAGATAALLVVAVRALAAENIVVNGGFENNANGPAPPWMFTTIGNVPGNLAGGYNVMGAAHSGSSAAILGATGNLVGGGVLVFGGTVSQAIAARRGGIYRLTYFALDLSTSGTTTYRVTSSLNGRTLATTTVNPTGQYQTITKSVKIKRGPSDLGFQVVTNVNAADPASELLLDDVSLTLLRSLGSIDFRKAALTSNERAVAAGLYNATKSPRADKGPFYNALTKVSASGAPAVLDSLSGEGITAAQNIAQRSAQIFNSAIFDQTTFYGSGNAGNSVTLTEPQPRFVALAAAQGQPIRELADLPASRVLPVFVAPQRTWRAWAAGFGGVEDIRGNAVAGWGRQDNSIFGGSLGVDYQVTPNYLAGIAIGGTDGAFRVANRATSGSTTGGHIAFYDIATFGAFYGASSNSFSYYTNRSTRFISGFGGLGNETERGSFDSHEFRTRLEFGRHFVGYSGTITPFVALELAQLRSNGFGETAVSGPGLFRLNVNGQSVADVPGFVGARYQSLMALGNGMTLSPSLQLAYVHEFAPYRQQIGNLSALPGATFLVDGARPSRNAAQVKAGGELQIGPHSALFANFDGEFSGVDQLYAGKGGFRYVW